MTQHRQEVMQSFLCPSRSSIIELVFSFIHFQAVVTRRVSMTTDRNKTRGTDVFLCVGMYLVLKDGFSWQRWVCGSDPPPPPRSVSTADRSSEFMSCGSNDLWFSHLKRNLFLNTESNRIGWKSCFYAEEEYMSGGNFTEGSKSGWHSPLLFHRLSPPSTWELQQWIQQ